MLFKQAVLDQIAAGHVSLAFRRWRKPTVKAGSRLRTAAGVLAVKSVETIEPAAISDADAQAAGYASRAALLRDLWREGELYRVAFHLDGADPRLALREAIDPEQVAVVVRELARRDSASRGGPWVGSVLRAIAENPGRRAAELAVSLGRETLPFKRRVRELKELGLTESLDVGYRLSPRGNAVLALLDDVRTG